MYFYSRYTVTVSGSGGMKISLKPLLTHPFPFQLFLHCKCQDVQSAAMVLFPLPKPPF